MRNNKDWFWEEGDKFIFKHQGWSDHDSFGPFTVVQVTESGVKYRNATGVMYHAYFPWIEPYVSEKLRKHLAKPSSWADDPESILHRDITDFIDHVRKELLDNEDAHCLEEDLVKRGLKLLANQKSHDPVHLATRLLEVVNLPYRRI